MTTGYGSVLSPGELALPIDLGRLGGGLAETVLEIGFGNGEYTVNYAAAHPDTLVIGMEVSFACVTRCARRIEQAGLNGAGAGNLKIICADARFMMRELFADESLDRVIMNFPCPWPKTRHAKRRVTAREFSDSLAAVLKTGGVFELVTDEEWYAAEVQKTLAAHGAFPLAAVETDFSRPAGTKYERKWLEMGKSIARVTAAKAAGRKFTADRRTWGSDFYFKGENMTMHFKTGRPLAESALASLAGVSGASQINGDSRWAFKGYYAAGGVSGKKFLVETVSTDDEFEQRYYLKVSERDGDTLVKLDGTAKVFLTPAVRLAAEDLARRLTEAAG